jgi:outer membrane protein TolC
VQAQAARPAELIAVSSVATGRLTFAEASRRWVERDQETLRQVMKALAHGLDETEAKSWVYPRADAEFHAATALERGDDGLETAPSGGLVLRYDFKKLVFHADAAAVAAASRDASLRRAQIAIEASIRSLEDLLVDWRQLQCAVALETERAALFGRLLRAVDALGELGALPAGSYAEWKRRQQETQRQGQATSRRLETVRQSLRTGLGLAPGAEPDVGSPDYLLDQPVLPEQLAGELEPRFWLPGVWQKHFACRVAELELFQAEMAIVGAKRERLPRLAGSMGLGDFDTWVGGERVDARATAEIGVWMPLFDAGSIGRTVEKARLQRDLARDSLRMLAQQLTRNIQNASAGLRDAQAELAHRSAEHKEASRLAEVAARGAALAQADPLLPLTLQTYRVESDLGLLWAKMNLVKAWRDYKSAHGEPSVPGLSLSILGALAEACARHEIAAK